ncbi:hypothetical protein CCHR01_14709 [Colletotrichum chrysophilum]|uniref:Uncharacterized protein n=1 Tax=Colletotrichum chrysophilum TaxID=1836956 RepID=A0AAD9ECH1_9PEZI|nr:hypothetical protein CCHR01_14709 [Colletotrichum chrysophilum]
MLIALTTSFLHDRYIQQTSMRWDVTVQGRGFQLSTFKITNRAALVGRNYNYREPRLGA